jgi:transcription factor E2F3
MQEKLKALEQDPIYSQYAYVTYDDIKRLNESEGNENSTLLAIRAPMGSTLEVPEPEEIERLHQKLANDSDPQSQKYSEYFDKKY